ncbi:MAG: leucine--tRNA ligase [Candidatus Moranbacteria bacterium]|nr:leucine--tRNA ligase [Candidatus Moranbacteria bacterium]MDD3964436.1 leucine--tRNA ligase [Candidatus Moranbacteria bacterium]
MKSTNQAYNPKKIEAKWQKEWKKNGHPKAKGKNGKMYILDMFPYPSGDGLHVGHVENFTATDIYARFKRMNGYDVLHPMGWDAFGLPAENFAIKTGIHPSKKTLESIKNFKRQMESIGLSYDWEREINTSSPEYYKWTQWMFLFLYKNGLAYKKKAKVNWCEACHTVLANEQVIDGKCDRSGDIVIQKDLEQWFFKITDFVEDTKSESGKKISGLLSGLGKVDWPSSTATAQKHWIGRSEGAEVIFPVANTEEEIRVFTTRVDTIFGCTYVVVAPEHPLISQQLTNNSQQKIQNKEEVKKYLAITKKKTDLERTELNKEKTGVVLVGIEAINPFTGEKVPVYVADYVLGTYGTGAVMGVPAHDERDFAFAKKYELFIQQSVASLDKKNETECFTEDGILIDSGEFTGLSSEEAREKMSAWLKKEKMGGKRVQYRLRDWLISRQRYWGSPIPIIYCDECGTVPVPEKDLPVKLPTDVDFRPTGESPLVRSKSFQRVKCPTCGKKARRESDTMDTFVCSSWYYLRFADPNNTKKFADPKKLAKYLPVDFYMGGAEHTVLHLLYARFFTKALAKYDYLTFDEPILKLRHQGMVIAEDGRKMSKSLGNVVNPDAVITELGADTLRLYEMFMGPLEDMKTWNTGSVIGLRRFLDKVWRLGQLTVNKKQSTENKKIEGLLHKTIKKVTEDVEDLKFNTAISTLMILVNAMEKEESLSPRTYQSFLILLSPFAPHITEELWQIVEARSAIRQLAEAKKSIFLAPWPKWDAKKIVEELSVIAVQVNGKVRATFEIATGSSEAEVKKVALEDPRVQSYTEGKQIRKIIYIQDKILSIVIA